MTEYFVGIDGGGTSCRARIRDQHGKQLGEGKSGSANILLGVDVALQSIIDAVTTATQEAGLDSSQLKHMHLGLALAGQNKGRFGMSLWLKPTLSLLSYSTLMLMGRA